MNETTESSSGFPSFIWWTGMVEDVNDPLYLGRCRVRIIGVHSSDKNSVPTNTLPWAHCLQPTTSAAIAGIGSSPTGLLVGSWVVGFFQDGDSMQFPVIMGSFGGVNQTAEEIQDGAGKAFNTPIDMMSSRVASKVALYAGKSDVNKLATGKDLGNTVRKAKVNNVEIGVPGAITLGSGWSEPVSRYNTLYPHNKVYESESGHVFEIDDSPSAERLHKYHRSGTFEEIHHDGTQVEKIRKNNYQIIEGTDHKLVKKDSFLNVDGDVSINIGGNIKIQATDDCKDIQIYFPHESKVTLNTGSFVHNVYGRYILNVTKGITIDGVRTDLNDPKWSIHKALYMYIPYLGMLVPNPGNSPTLAYKTNLARARNMVSQGSVQENMREEINQLAAEQGVLPSGDEAVDFELFDEPTQIAEQVLANQAEENDSILAQLGGGAANLIGGVVEGTVGAFIDAIEGAGEFAVGLAANALYSTEAYQALQQGTALAQQNLAMIQGVANNVQGAAGDICSIIDLFSGLKGVSFGSPAEFFEKLAEGLYPLGDIPEAVGDAFEQLVQGAVEAVEEFAAELVQPFVDIIDQTEALVSGVGDLLSDPCGAGGAGLAGAGSGSVSAVSPGAVSGTQGEDDYPGMNSAQIAHTKDLKGSAPVGDPLLISTPIIVARTPFAMSQASTNVAGSPVMTSTPLGAVNVDVIAPSEGGPCIGIPTPANPLASIGGLAGLAALGAAAGVAGAALASAAGGGGGVGAQGPTGPTGSTGPDEEWDILQPTKATNLEGIPQGTTFAFGLSPLDILKELLYPSLLKFNSFDVGINDEGERVPYHVGDKTLSGDYLSSWTIQDVESAVENSLKIVEGENILVENLGNTLTEYTINHPEYGRNSEGSVDFVISVLNEKEQEVTKTDSIFWRYPLYAGKSSANVITSEDLETLSVTTNQFGGKNPFINYTIQQMKSGITMIFPQTDEPEYLYWVVPKEVDGESTNPPSYGVNTSFTDVSNPNVTTVVPMTRMDDISITKYGLTIDFDVYRSSVPFIGSRTIKVSE